MKESDDNITIKIKNIFAFFIGILLIFLYLANVKNISDSIILSLKNCCINIIPSLFPTLLISSIMLYANWLEWILKKFKMRILGNCKIYTSPICLGLVCGFITGAKGICEIYKKVSSESNDFSLAIALSSNAGLGFVIGVVGIKIWNDVYYGIYLYLSQIITAFFVFSLLKSKKSLEMNFINIQANYSAFDIISKAVNNTINALIIICSFNIFTSALMSIFTSILNPSPLVTSILLSLFDFSSAVFFINDGSTLFHLFINGFAIGFAGLSVHMQTFTVCDGFPLKKGKFILFKLLQGLLCGSLSMLYTIF